MIKSRIFTFFLLLRYIPKEKNENSWVVEVGCATIYFSIETNVKLQIFML